MELKTCTKCGQVFPATTEYFRRHPGSRDGLRPECKVCAATIDRAYRVAHKEQATSWYETHKEQATSCSRAYRETHKTQMLAAARIYRKAHAEEIAAGKRTWHQTHHKYYNEYARLRRQNDPKLRIAQTVSRSIAHSLRGRKAGRHWETLVGYTLDDLMRHLESQFLLGMTWERYGEFHIDHIRPIASFNFTSPDDLEFRQCWALSNLQPLWAEDNMRKGAKWQEQAV